MFDLSEDDIKPYINELAGRAKVGGLTPQQFGDLFFSAVGAPGFVTTESGEFDGNGVFPGGEPVQGKIFQDEGELIRFDIGSGRSLALVGRSNHFQIVYYSADDASAEVVHDFNIGTAISYIKYALSLDGLLTASGGVSAASAVVATHLATETGGWTTNLYEKLIHMTANKVIRWNADSAKSFGILQHDGVLKVILSDADDDTGANNVVFTINGSGIVGCPFGSNIAFDNTGTDIAATTIEGALAELALRTPA